MITRREIEILELISKGMTNPEIATRLFISSTTVDIHRKNLLAKFEAKNVASMVRVAIEMNFI